MLKKRKRDPAKLDEIDHYDVVYYNGKENEEYDETYDNVQESNDNQYVEEIQINTITVENKQVYLPMTFRKISIKRYFLNKYDFS